VNDGLRIASERGLLAASVDDLMSRIRSVNAIDDLPRGANAVIEAVPEIPGLKAEVLSVASAAMPPDVVIASNTSSISIDRLAASVTVPGRFVGTHFFNPVPRSRLVEIVRGTRTTGEIVNRTAGWVRALGRDPIIVADSPGFASSRLGVLLGLEAIRMLEEGVASAEDIDRAMTLGYGHSMGPLRSTDLVGLDVRLAIAEYLEVELGERFAPPQLLRDHVAHGRLGRSTGRGFYDWPG
jgi:3-hydroxybutyryl-CoA dehydrogenase